MMPARVSKHHPRLRGKGKDRKKILAKIVVFAFVVLFFGFLFLKVKDVWMGKAKIFLAIRSEDEGANVAIFDQDLGEIVSIYIPPTTQVEVAQDLGVWRLESVWKIGIREGLGGGLLAKTITKQFKFPVYFWADSPAQGLIKASPIKLLRAVFFKYGTNLSFIQRLGLAVFSLNVKNFKRVEIDLAQTSYLSRTRLVDGQEGYVVSERPPQNIMVLFADPRLSEKVINIMIIDKTGKSGVAEEVGKILEVLGGKVASFSKEKEEDFNCYVKGDRYIVTSIAPLFSCKVVQGQTSGIFDFEISLGSEFAKNF